MTDSKEKLHVAATIAEIVAAVGVIVSVIYLAIQISDSNNEARQQTYNNTLILMHTPLWQMVENEALAKVIKTGGTTPELLSEDEWFRYGYWWLTQFNMYEYLYIAHLKDQVVPELWLGTDASFAHEFAMNPGIREVWFEWRHAYADPFQTYVDAKIRQSAVGAESVE